MEPLGNRKRALSDEDDSESESVQSELPAYVTRPRSNWHVKKDGSPRKKYATRKFAQLDRQGNVLKVWDSAAAAATHFGIKAKAIANAAAPDQRQKFAGGYRWARHEPDLAGEVWRVHPVYTHIRVSNKGRVQLSKGKKTFGSTDEHGYKRIKLFRKKLFRVHRLVMQTFRPFDGDDDQMDVNHKDGNKGNNALENLEWNTPRENIEHYTQKLLPKYKRRRIAEDVVAGRMTRSETVTETKTVARPDGTVETVTTTRKDGRRIVDVNDADDRAWLEGQDFWDEVQKLLAKQT
jgi:hypothetical protein